MNFASFERAQVAGFAYREARHTGEITCMRAICFVLRNRVRSGHGDGTWLSVIENHYLIAASDSPSLDRTDFHADRLLQMIVRDIDEIYLGQDRADDNVRQMVCGADFKKEGALYYSFVDRQPRPWFVENIIRQSADHRQTGTIGTLMLYK